MAAAVTATTPTAAAMAIIATTATRTRSMLAIQPRPVGGRGEGERTGGGAPMRRVAWYQPVWAAGIVIRRRVVRLFHPSLSARTG